MDIASRAARTFRERGPRGFAEVLRRHARYKGKEAWLLARGEYPIEFDGVSVSMLVNDRGDVNEIDHFVNSELDVLKDVLDEIETGETFVDVGANIGQYSVPLASVGAEVLAYEPNPRNAEHLVKNVRRNFVDVDIRALALSDSTGSVPFTVPDDDRIGSVGFSTDERSLLRVPTRRAEDDIETTPDVVKVDVEGAEELVIDGFGDRLAECRVLYCEIHRENSNGVSIADFGGSVESLLAKIDAHGFDRETIVDDGNRFIVKAT